MYMNVKNERLILYIYIFYFPEFFIILKFSFWFLSPFSFYSFVNNFITFHVFLNIHCICYLVVIIQMFHYYSKADKC